MSDQPTTKTSTTQDNITQKDKDKLHALSGIWTHDLVIQAIKAYVPDCMDTGTSR
jgi:hypothetical protein